MNSPPTIAFPAFLVSVEVLQDRGLRIVLEDRTGRGPLQQDADGLGLEGRDIIRQNSDCSYEIIWEVVVCFAVRGDPFPKESGLRATIKEAPDGSAFLPWVESQSRAEPEYVATIGGDFEKDPSRRLRHWVIVCNEATFDVAALYAPNVRVITTRPEDAPLQ
ncbi:hypothetical protein [Aquisediminimonas profunda]|uniref:hypothetical protein n=1 Tax=Aquisediminimonas profunda TaxID=1550733 RepID=UPI001C629564|nr:hypothetical protein [Aquisediminimonas profunda]